MSSSNIVNLADPSIEAEYRDQLLAARQRGEVSIEIITPKQAAFLLRTFKNFRRLRPIRSRRIAEDIREGNWRVTGQAIVIDENGNLVDGQHRLDACVRAQRPIISVVYRGYTDVLTIDIGKPRTVPDFLTFDGEVNTHLLAATVRLLLADEDGSLETALLGGTHAIETPRAIAEAIERFGHDLLRSAVQIAKNQRVAPAATLAVLAYKVLATKEDHLLRRLELFHLKLRTGEDLRIGEPILALRERLLANRVATLKLGRVAVAAMIFKTWNAFILGRNIKTLRFGSDETFPAIVLATSTAPKLKELL